MFLTGFHWTFSLVYYTLTGNGKFASNMLWLKRLSPIVLIGLIASTFFVMREKRSAEEIRQVDAYARAMAQVWVASASFRYDEDQFIAFRDSILKDRGVAIADIESFFKKYEAAPEEYDVFTSLVSKYVDSLFRIKDSLIRQTEAVSDTTESTSR